MTSGQDGGSGHQPPDRPAAPPSGSGWAPAPPPPPPTYPGRGYGPAPSAPQGFGAPPAMERPSTVRFGLGAFIAGLILGAIGLIYEALNFSAILDVARAQLSQQQSDQISQITPDLERTILILSLVIGLVVLAIEALFVWFAWQGRNWARIVLWVVAGLSVVFGGVGLASSSYLPGFVQGLSICQWLLSAVAIVLLALKPSNEWYRYRKWLRATGQRG